MDINEFRQKYPQYDHVSDLDLSQALHDKYYSHVPFDQFSNKFGVPVENQQLQLPPEPGTEPAPYQEQPLPSHEAQAQTPGPEADIPKYPGFGVGLPGENYVRPPSAGEMAASIPKSVPGLTKQVAGGLGLAAIEQMPTEPTMPAAVSGLPGMEIPELPADVQKARQDIIKQEAKPMLELYKQGTKELEKVKPEGMTDLQKFAYDVSIAGVKMIPAVGVSMASKNPWAFAAVFYPDVYANKYGELSARFPNMTPAEKSMHAHVAANIEVLTEKIPIGELMKFGKPFLQRMVNTMAAEGGQEAASGILQNLYDMATTNPDMTFMDAVKEAGYEGLVGAAMGAGMVTATTPIEAVTGKLSAKQQEKQQASQIEEFLRQRAKQQANQAMAPSQKPLQAAPTKEAPSAVSQPEATQPNGNVQQPERPSQGQRKLSTGESGKGISTQGQRQEVSPPVRAEVTPEVKTEIDQAAHEAATSPTNDIPEPTPAQKEAGNYKVGHMKIQGLDISIENPAGSVRSGTDSDGETWQQTIKNHYGYIKGTVGKDKDHIDVFLGPKAEKADTPVFVVDQVNPKTGKFDEHKVMMGFPTQMAARKAYLANYAKGWQGLGNITQMSMDEFKQWTKGDTTKPAAKAEIKQLTPKQKTKGLPESIQPNDITELAQAYAKAGLKYEDFASGVKGFYAESLSDYVHKGTKNLKIDEVKKLTGGKTLGAWYRSVTKPQAPAKKSAIEGMRKVPEPIEQQKIEPSPEEVKKRIKPAEVRRKTERREESRTEPGRRKADRRQDVARREKIAAMTPEEQYAAIYGHELTGLNNRRAFNEDLPSAKVVLSIDVDALKTVNDYLGQSTGDELLMTVANALHEVSDNAYHISGDEFYMLGESKAELVKQAKAAQKILATQSVSSAKGNLNGIGFSFGVAEKGGRVGKDEADSAMKQDKKDREAVGTRAGRGELPKNLTLTAKTQEAQQTQAPVSTKQKGQPPKASDIENAPGAKYKGLRESGKLPQVATPRAEARQQSLPKRQQGEVVRRETIIKDLEKSFGMKIYQGRVKGKTRLGFHRKTNNEVRIKTKNDLEVTAHEVAHWIDDRYPAFSKIYKQEPYKTELEGVSYDAEKLNEGFAEFMRLYMTQETEAVTRAPKFYDKFQQIVKDVGIKDAIDRVQTDMHAWYEQGALNRLKSKIGKPKNNISAWFRDITDQWGDKVLLNVFDSLQGIKIAERELTGNIQDADLSPYKNARLVAGSRGVAKAVFEHGTIGWNKNGDIEFTGKGLRQVFEPVADAIDDAMLYFAAKRATELKGQGRENLMRNDEIAAGLALGETNPAIKKAHEEYKQFNSRMMDFYEQSGLVSHDGRKAMEKMNQEYVPFHRIIEAATGEKIGASTPFKRLTGGTGNLNDIMDNITYSTSSLIHAALINRAKQLTYGMIENSKNGAKFATKIPKDTHAAQINKEQVLDSFVKGILGITYGKYKQLSQIGQGNPEMDQVLDLLESNMDDFATFFTFGHIPKGANIDTVMVNGERQVYEIADPIFLKSIEAFGPKSVNLALRIAGGFKGLLTRAVTTMPDFQIPNLLRDSFAAYTMSKGRMIPVVDSVRGLVDRLKSDDVYWEFMANGGGFSSTVHGETMRRDLEKFYIKQGINPKTVLYTPRRLIDKWEEINSAFEYGTRLAEYKKIRAKGGSKREATLGGREISTDFAMRGTSDFLRTFTTMVPFMNARIQGLYRMAREMSETKGKMGLIGENAAQFALRGITAITLPTLALYFLNRDDDRYKELPDWVKDLHWVILPPGQDEALLIPKPFEIGQIFATVPERSIELYETHNGKKFADSMLFVTAQAFAMDPTPQIIKPGVSLAMNHKWTGAPVIPEDLQGLEPMLQYRPWTPETLIQLGKYTNTSPMKMEELIRGYFGSMGIYALAASDYLINDRITGAKPEMRLDQVPVLRRFIRQQPYRGTQYETDFYKLLQEVEKITRSFNELQKRALEGDAEKYMKSDERKKLYALSDSTRQLRSYISDLNKQMRLVQQDKTMSAKEKRTKLDELQRQKNELFKQASTQMDPRKLQKIKREIHRGME